jgi:hypothetical protein
MGPEGRYQILRLQMGQLLNAPCVIAQHLKDQARNG